MERCRDHQVPLLTSTLTCQVVPDIPTFAVDDGFSYSVPEQLHVRIGSRVRIKVSGRRLKGFVTAVFEADPDRSLLPVEGLSGDVSSFDDTLLATLRWASTYYVTPLSTLLRRTLPPNVPKRAPETETTSTLHASPTSVTYRIGAAPHGASVVSSIIDASVEDRNVVVIAPTVVEIEEIAEKIESALPGRVVLATSSMPGAVVTKTWALMARPTGSILVATRETMFWPFADVGLVVVVEDGRRVMRSPGSPTAGVREVILQRATAEKFPVVFHGPVPTLEVMYYGAAIVAPPSRQWPDVDIADRGDEPPTGSLLTHKAEAAIRRATSADKRTFVLVGSRGYAPAFRCIACGEVRRCPECNSAASRGDICRRCGHNLGGCNTCQKQRFQALGAGIGRTIDDIKRLVGDNVGAPEDGKLVSVGSERDLIGIHNMGLALAIDIDGLTMAPNYRAAEDALRLLVRLSQTVQGEGGGSCLVQTAMPDQAVVVCLVGGRSDAFLESELDTRKSLAFPPAGSLIALEVRGGVSASALLRDGIGDSATLLGPADVADGERWLIQGRDLTAARVALRSVLGTLRNKGATVRVDVDPIDL